MLDPDMDCNVHVFLLQLWDVRRKGCIFTYKGHSDVVHSIQFSPDGKWIVSTSEDGSAKVHVAIMHLCVVRCPSPPSPSPSPLPVSPSPLPFSPPSPFPFPPILSLSPPFSPSPSLHIMPIALGPQCWEDDS